MLTKLLEEAKSAQLSELPEGSQEIAGSLLTCPCSFSVLES